MPPATSNRHDVPGDKRPAAGNRWRLALGSDSTDSELEGADREIDRALDAVYDTDRCGGLGTSSPGLARWLGDIRKYFPSSAVHILQNDAIDRFHLHALLLEPETLESIDPDIELAAGIVSMAEMIPSETRETARDVVGKVLADIMERVQLPLRQSVARGLDRRRRTHRPGVTGLDMARTITANLRNYRPEFGAIIPETLYGHPRHRRSGMKDVIICVDQSGSMASSLVYASVFAAALASLPSLRTRLVLFDTSIADMTSLISNPVDVLFGAQLGGGTDIAQALEYCRAHVQRPDDTVLVLVSDLFEGGNRGALLRQAAAITASGVRMIALLALNDDGIPAHDQTIAGAFASLNIPTFAATPDRFAEEIGRWLG